MAKATKTVSKSKGKGGKQSKFKKVVGLFNPRSLKGGMALFALVFAVSGGGYYVYRSFAAVPVTIFYDWGDQSGDYNGPYTGDSKGQDMQLFDSTWTSVSPIKKSADGNKLLGYRSSGTLSGVKYTHVVDIPTKRILSSFDGQEAGWIDNDTILIVKDIVHPLSSRKLDTIYSVNIDGTEEKKLNNPVEYLNSSCVSKQPGGSLISYVKQSVSQDANQSLQRTAIVTMNTDGSNKKEIYIMTNRGDQIESCPIWSRGGGKLAFAYSSTVEGDVAAVVNANGTGLTKLGGAEGYNYYLANHSARVNNTIWSPDSKKIVVKKSVIKDGKVVNNLYTVDIATKQYTQITSSGGKFSFGEPMWTKDNRIIYFSYTGVGQCQERTLYSLDPVTKSAVKISPPNSTACILGFSE